MDGAHHLPVCIIIELYEGGTELFFLKHIFINVCVRICHVEPKS